MRIEKIFQALKAIHGNFSSIPEKILKEYKIDRFIYDNKVWLSKMITNEELNKESDLSLFEKVNSLVLVDDKIK